MKESILHYIWEQKLFVSSDFTTIDGRKLEIIDVGRINTDAGPDFFNAKIKIENTIWVGNVEIHKKASDWYKHHHQNNKAYDNVILHLVQISDTEIKRSDGQLIHQAILGFDSKLELTYEAMMQSKKWVACADAIHSVPSIYISNWKNSLLAERYMQKTNHVAQILQTTNFHWEEAFYILLARSFGFGTNSQAFELLAKSIPLNVLAKHKNNLMQLEALLFGQSGLLTGIVDDSYALKLANEYRFLKLKYDLKPIDSSHWKMLRLRPDNFPHLRIAQFASIIHSSSKLFSKIIDDVQLGSIKKLFAIAPSDYWKTHYLFGVSSTLKIKHLGNASIQSIIINTIIPILFSYSERLGSEILKEKALQVLDQIPAEKNSIVSAWRNLDMKIESAFDSQAFLHLKKNYCDEKKCLRCIIGHKILNRKFLN